jgi:hypothetical protein
LLIGPLPDTPAERVHLTLIAPRGGLSVRLEGKAVRRERIEGDELALGVEFENLGPELEEKLEALLARVMEGMAPGPLEGLRPGASPHEVRKALEEIPLAQRIALASRAGPRDREFLRQDLQPPVLDALVRNPNLALPEALALAALPHLPPSAIEHLASDLRWAQSEELRLLLLAHPRTPTPLADRLLGELSPPALRRLLGRSLPGPIREKAIKRLRRLSS